MDRSDKAMLAAQGAIIAIALICLAVWGRPWFAYAYVSDIRRLEERIERLERR